jgi:DNA-binding NarL/FixJ family response regulator
MRPVRVSVYALDPITTTGMINCLAAYPDVHVVGNRFQDGAEVVVATFDRLTEEATTMLHQVAVDLGKPVILVTNHIGELSAEHNVVAVLPPTAATDSRLLHSIQAAATGLADEPIDQAHPEPGTHLSAREIHVLRLVADGMDTAEIAAELSYSERTVKNILYTLTKRLNLRNRSHAVAYAMRAGVI